jgi:hypothetical protein
MMVGDALSLGLVALISLIEGLLLVFLAASAADTNQNAAAMASAEPMSSASELRIASSDYRQSRDER